MRILHFSLPFINRFWAVVIFISYISNSNAQDAKYFMDQLESKKQYNEYLTSAIDYGLTLTRNRGLNEGQKLFDLALKKSKSKGGSTAQNMVEINIARSLIKCCYATSDVNQYVSNTIRDIAKKDNKKLYADYISDLASKINELETDPQLLGRMYDNMSEYLPASYIKELKQTNRITKEAQSLKKEISQKSEQVDEIASQLSQTSATLSQTNATLASTSDKVSALAEASEIMTEVISEQQQRIELAEYRLVIDSLSQLQQEAEIARQQEMIALKERANQNMKIAICLIGLSMLLTLYFLIKTLTFNKLIKKEKARSEELLLNILPKEIADELKEHGKVETRYFEDCSILFLDFVGFSYIAKQSSPTELVKDLNTCFTKIDELAQKHEIEKIKTIGDAYMCVSGLNEDKSNTAVKQMVDFARDVISYLEGWNKERAKQNKLPFQARIGIHNGPIAAGIVGKHKFCYDIWGDAVNVAARIESNGVTGNICISDATYKLLGQSYKYDPLGMIEVKNMQPISMYLMKN